MATPESVQANGKALAVAVETAKHAEVAGSGGAKQAAAAWNEVKSLLSQAVTDTSLPRRRWRSDPVLTAAVEHGGVAVVMVIRHVIAAQDAEKPSACHGELGWDLAALCVKLLRHLSRASDSKAVLHNTGVPAVCTALLQCISAHHAEHGAGTLAGNCVIVLHNLALDEARAMDLMAANGVQAVHTAMQQFPGTHDVQAYSGSFVLNMAHHVCSAPGGRRRLLDDGAMRIIMAVIGRGVGSVQEQEFVQYSVTAARHLLGSDTDAANEARRMGLLGSLLALASCADAVPSPLPAAPPTWEELGSATLEAVAAGSPDAASAAGSSPARASPVRSVVGSEHDVMASMWRRDDGEDGGDEVPAPPPGAVQLHHAHSLTGPTNTAADPSAQHGVDPPMFPELLQLVVFVLQLLINTHPDHADGELTPGQQPQDILRTVPHADRWLVAALHQQAIASRPRESSSLASFLSTLTPELPMSTQVWHSLRGISHARPAVQWLIAHSDDCPRAIIRQAAQHFFAMAFYGQHRSVLSEENMLTWLTQQLRAVAETPDRALAEAWSGLLWLLAFVPNTQVVLRSKPELGEAVTAVKHEYHDSGRVQERLGAVQAIQRAAIQAASR